MNAYRFGLAGGLLAVGLAIVGTSRLGAQEVPSETRARTSPRPFSMELRFSGVFDSNIDHDENDLDSYGGEAGLRARLQTKGWQPVFALEYAGSAQGYTQSDRWDRVSHQVRATLSREVGDVTVSAFGELSTRAATEDREIANQYTIRPTVSYDLGDRVEVSIYGAHRKRRFPDNPNRDESIWYMGSEFAVELWDGGQWGVGYRYETSDSETLSRRYDRQRYTTELDASLGAVADFDIELEYRPREFPGLLVDGGGIEVPRADRRLIPTASLTFRLPDEHWIRLAYEFERRRSNDLGKEYEAHRYTVTFRWALIGRRR